MFDISVFRKHARHIVRALGFLAPKHPCGMSYSKVHALIELGQNSPISAKALSEALWLDKSSISRLISDLVEENLLTEATDPNDTRSKLISLTSKGVEKLAEINAGADRQVKAVLSFLSPSEQELVAKGFEKYAQALKKHSVIGNLEIRAIMPDEDTAMAQICRDVLREFGADRAGFAYVDSELDSLSRVYAQSGWQYLVCKQADQILGGAGIGPLQGANAQYCELKKMYLSETSRGLGIGRVLINTLLNEARAMGYVYCYLETLTSMVSAIALYERLGFQKLDKPLGNTGHFGCDAWYLLEL